MDTKFGRTLQHLANGHLVLTHAQTHTHTRTIVRFNCTSDKKICWWQWSEIQSWRSCERSPQRVQVLLLLRRYTHTLTLTHTNTRRHTHTHKHIHNFHIHNINGVKYNHEGHVKGHHKEYRFYFFWEGTHTHTNTDTHKHTQTHTNTYTTSTYTTSAERWAVFKGSL